MYFLTKSESSSPKHYFLVIFPIFNYFFKPLLIWKLTCQFRKSFIHKSGQTFSNDNKIPDNYHDLYVLLIKVIVIKLVE